MENNKKKKPEVQPPSIPEIPPVEPTEPISPVEPEASTHT